ncbi:MAG: hypothetical protein FWF02_00060 [Micrococcales bacterium]|nr:hypothetical protein [Micrococcales bacterium]MCL2666092.1 hypothetical protein [Micrococcales bacterium]
MKVLLKVVIVVVSVLVGVIVGALGSVGHWSHRPWGLVAGLVLVLAAATTMRAWDGYTPLAGFFVAMGAVLVVFSRHGPGGDVLVHLSDTRLGLDTDPSLYGRIWVGGAVVATVLVAFGPKALFSDRPAGYLPPTPADAPDPWVGPGPRSGPVGEEPSAPAPQGPYGDALPGADEPRTHDAPGEVPDGGQPDEPDGTPGDRLADGPGEPLDGEVDLSSGGPAPTV